jgi:FlaA1/EpsC-like NDP-sugar epimerase
MVDVNISNTITSLDLAEKRGASKYFCVSTDKAANPVSMMGASKRIMEMYLIAESVNISVSTARFANVAFSDGSLLYGFNRRLEKNQPLSAPMDVKRYFVTPKESGELCLMSCLLGKNRELFFPKLDFQHNLLSFSDIAIRYLQRHGYEYILCSSEEEARDRVLELKPKRQWPVYFFHSDTTGEKEYEEFYMEHEKLDLERFSSIGVILNEAISDPAKLERFTNSINVMKSKGQWDRNQIIDIFNYMIPEFKHKETGKFLDQRM